MKLHDVFTKPPKSFSPVATWWWSGDKLDPKRLRWQMEQMAAGEIYNLLVMNLAPAGPKSGSLADDPKFFSDEWWAVFRQVCADARALGMHIWFYDQFGFSSANIQGNLIKENGSFAGQWLECITKSTDGSAVLECPPEGQPLAAVVIPINADGHATAQPVHVKLNGKRLVWSGQGSHRLRLFYVARRAYDYLNPKASAKLLDTVHGAFERNAGEYLGNVIAGTFQDELEAMPTWSDDFAQQFRQLKGYDLLQCLTALYEGDDAASGQTRADYYAVRGAIVENTFFRPLGEWHKQHNMIGGFDQNWPIRAGDPVASTHHYADYMRTHRWYGAPGSDAGGETKVHSSIAHLYNQPRVWLEAFHSTGWGGTLEETFDWMLPKLRAGGTLYNPHALYYSTHGGWWEWAPPSTCWRQPYWRHYPLFCRAVTRLCAVLSEGDHVCDIGVLYPSATVQDGLTLDGVTKAADEANSIYHRLVGLSDMVRQNLTKGVLDADRRDFDIIDDSSVQRAEIQNGTLHIGREAYKAVALPGCIAMESATASTLVRFVESGGLLVAVGALPQRVAGKTADADSVEKLRSLFTSGAAVHVENPEDLPQALAELPRQVESPLPSLLRKVDGRLVLFIPAAFPCATDFKPGRRGGYSFSPGSYAESIEITVHSVNAAPELWDPVTGERTLLSAIRNNNSVTVQVPFAASPAALLVWPIDDDCSTPPTVAAAGTPALKVTHEMAGLWNVQLEQTMDNSYGDFDKPDYAGAPPVQTWDFLHRVEGVGENGLSAGWQNATGAIAGWQEAHATFGTYAWWTGPSLEQELPDPLILAAGATGLCVDGWKPAEYSLSRGIYRDPQHAGQFGSRGYVPEEFLRFGTVKPGQGVQCRTSVWLPLAQSFVLTLGAPAQKRVWVNGVELASSSAGDLWQILVSFQAGVNTIEFRLLADHANSDLRAYWALVRNPEAFTRPEWMAPSDTARQGSRIVFSKSIDISFAVERARLQLAVGTPLLCSLWVNGVEVARQGGRARVQFYDVTNFHQGANEVCIQTEDPGRGTEVMLDGVIYGASGRRLQLVSAADWLAQRDNSTPAPVQLGRRIGLMGTDPRSSTLIRRPHPLPAAHWLEEPADATVAPIVPDALPGVERVEWLRWIAPPGAISAQLPVNGKARCFVDGVEVEVVDGHILFPAGRGEPRFCVARIEPSRGRTGGALLKGPVTYTVGSGRMGLGDWASQGLAAHSGGVRYSTSIELEHLGDKVYWLDLGEVRGTVELSINSQTVGARIWAPYRFEVTTYLHNGKNSIEILVLNTLGPYLKASSPTPFVFKGQEVSGMFGPVRLLSTDGGEL